MELNAGKSVKACHFLNKKFIVLNFKVEIVYLERIRLNCNKLKLLTLLVYENVK